MESLARIEVCGDCDALLSKLQGNHVLVLLDLSLQSLELAQKESFDFLKWSIGSTDTGLSVRRVGGRTTAKENMSVSICDIAENISQARRKMDVGRAFT